MKYKKEVGKLLLKIKEKKEKELLNATNNSLQGMRCIICQCEIEEHENYVYCEMIGAYICDVCCRYEVCNDYKLVNKALGREIFKDNSEIIMLCESCK